MGQIGIARGFVVAGRTMADPIYFPKHSKNGKEINQKALVTVAINRKGYKDKVTGQIIEKPPVKIQVGAWNGLADTIARGCPTGQELSFEMEIESYDAMVKIPQGQPDGTTKYVPVMKPDGSGYVTEQKVGFSIIPGTLRFGRDSQKIIDNEIVANERPMGWNGQLSLGMIEAAIGSGTLSQLVAQAKNGPEAWKAMLRVKNSQEYTGGPKFGYAKVMRPSGNVELAYPLDQAVSGAVNAGQPTVDGYTYGDMIAAGWDDEQLLTADNGKWATLVPKKAPAPPAPKAVPTPPAPVQKVAEEVKTAAVEKVAEMKTESFEGEDEV